ADGGVDAALQVHRVGAGGDGLEAFAHDRLGEHSGGGGAVAGFVRGVGSDFLHHLRAHVLELVLQLDFLRDRHAVLGDGGGAEALLEHRVAALRAQRRLYGVRQDVDAFEHSRAGVITETYFFSCDVSQTSAELLLDNGHHVFFAHDEKLFAVDFHFGTAVLAEQDVVADFDVERTHFAVLQDLALADRHHLALDRLLGRGVGNHDAARGGALLFETLDDHAVVERANFQFLSHRSNLDKNRFRVGSESNAGPAGRRSNPWRP